MVEALWGEPPPSPTFSLFQNAKENRLTSTDHDDLVLARAERRSSSGSRGKSRSVQEFGSHCVWMSVDVCVCVLKQSRDFYNLGNTFLYTTGATSSLSLLFYTHFLLLLGPGSGGWSESNARHRRNLYS